MEELLTFRVKEVRPEAPQALSLILEPQNGEELSYLPGQFLTFIFQRRGRELRRSFSLSSSPYTDALPSITFRRIPNGEISTYLYENSKPGDILTAIPPAGRFTYTPQQNIARDIFLIAAGSGITPLYSILKSALVAEPQSHITLIYSNRNERSTIFYEQLNALQEAYTGRFRCMYVFSDPDDHSHPYNAHLNLALLRSLADENLRYAAPDAEFYLCGPFTFMRMAEMALIMRFEKEAIHKENFVILAEESRIQQSPIIDQSDKQVIIHYRGQVHDLIIPYNKSILTAAIDQKLSLPYSCRGGVCGVCAAMCTKGKVKMSVNEVLTDRETAQGWVLTCTGYAETKDVELVFK